MGIHTWRVVGIFHPCERHCLDVEGRQEDLLVSQNWLSSRGGFGWEDHTHPTHVDFNCGKKARIQPLSAEPTVIVKHSVKNFCLSLFVPALRSALLRGDPLRTLILGRFFKSSHSPTSQKICHIRTFRGHIGNSFSTHVWCNLRPPLWQPEWVRCRWGLRPWGASQDSATRSRHCRGRRTQR